LASLGCSLAVAAGIAGSLGEPPLEDRWTSLEILNSSEDDSASVDLASGDTCQMTARITFRQILTGAIVSELRASSTITTDMVELNPDEQIRGTARDVDYILQNSVTAGRDFHSVTGYPELRREFSFNTTGFVPTDTTLTGPIIGLFLVLYMGDEEEIELADGRDSIVITPFESERYQILHKGIAIPLGTP
jgi:hypothetical protein